MYLEVAAPTFRGEVFTQTDLQAVKRQVRQNWGDDAALRRAFIRWVESGLFYEAGFQPLLE